MRVRITATVALLVAIGLALAGLIVFVIESRRIDERNMAAAQQELDEFVQGVESDRDGLTGPSLQVTFENFIASNVPDVNELLIGWIGEAPAVGNADDRLLGDPAFLAAARPLVDIGGASRIDTDRGEAIISAQPIRQAGRAGAMIVVTFVDPEQAGLRDTMRTYTIVSALSLLMISGIAFGQSGRLLAPLRTVRETAQEIGETDLSRRLPVRGNDDITALTRTFNGMLVRLESAFVAQRRLLDDAGHELRTPLTILQGHLELLDVDDPAEVAETRALLLGEVDRMTRLCNDLILLARSDRPDFLSTAPIDVAALSETVLAKASGLGERTWVLDEAAHLVVDADEQRITQALLQLAHNAVKHTSSADIVALGSAQSGATVTWWVRDTGPGVPEGDRERIFERFGRGTESAGAGPDSDGFGLGLSIVTAIAQAHGGRAWLDPSYADGARFVLAVPIIATDSRPPEDPSWPAS